MEKEEGLPVSQDHAPPITAVTSGQSEGWQSMESAPKDGTPILAWCVHPHARYAGDEKEWCAPVVTQWTTFNGGGWTWHGMVGRFTHWRPLPAPPETALSGRTAKPTVVLTVQDEPPNPSPRLPGEGEG